MSAVPQETHSQFQVTRNRKDRRRNRRVAIRIKGRFLNEVSEDKGLETRNISCSGALIESDHTPPMGARIVCYFDQLGRVAATVTRVTEFGFAVEFHTTQTKRDRLADKLIWMINRDPLQMSEERKAARYSAGGPAMVQREDGRDLQCRVIDISLSGASFNTDGPLPIIGETVRAGNLFGRVVRSENNFFAVRYLTKAEMSDR